MLRSILAPLLRAALGLVVACPGMAMAYNGKLTLVFGDIKRAVAGLEPSTGGMTASNYRTIIDGIKSKLHCNGLRLYIDPNIADPAAYPQLYKDVLDYARSQGLHIYANPLGTGTFGKSTGEWADWIARYANYYRPKYLGPFNESSWSAADTITIVNNLNPKLTYRPVLVGPDKQKVQDTYTFLQQNPAVISKFDVIGAHNAANDTTATPWAWWRLRQDATKTTWSTENPRDWSLMNSNADEVGVKAVVDTAGPIEGLVIYLAFPYCMDFNGSLKPKGQAIADGIGFAPDNWLAITTPVALPVARPGNAYTAMLQAANGTAPYTWSLVSGSLPAGMELSGAGVISGTSAASLTARFRVRVTDAELLSVEKDLSLIIGLAPDNIDIADGGVENPAIGSGQYQYAPAGGVWSFLNTSGIVANGSAFGNPNAPEGAQAAFVQGYGSMIQTVMGFVPWNVYKIHFKAAERPGNRQSWDVKIGNTVIGSYNPGSGATSYADYTTSPFTATAAAHTLAFAGTNLAGGDNTIFIDNVTIEWIVVGSFTEYAFGLDPTKVTGVPPVTAPSRTSGTFTYTRRDPALTGLSYIYQYSTTLNGAWTSVTPAVPDIVSAGAGSTQTVTVNLTGAPGNPLANTKLFIRVVASGP